MGTRHLTMVQLDGQYRIAQYGQWDGYPSGQGSTVLEFLKTWNRPVFEQKLRAITWLTQADADALNEEIKAKGLQDKWQRLYPELSRDTGAEILEIVEKAQPGIKLKNGTDFAGDSLMCEYAYVIDLDANTLEVFKGFNCQQLQPGERFAAIPTPDNRDFSPPYFQIRLAKSYPLSDLPTVKQMEKDVDPPDQDEEAA